MRKKLNINTYTTGSQEYILLQLQNFCPCWQQYNQSTEHHPVSWFPDEALYHDQTMAVAMLEHQWLWYHSLIRDTNELSRILYVLAVRWEWQSSQHGRCMDFKYIVHFTTNHLKALAAPLLSLGQLTTYLHLSFQTWLCFSAHLLCLVLKWMQFISGFISEKLFSYQRIWRWTNFLNKMALRQLSLSC